MKIKSQRNKLVEDNMGLVYSISKKYKLSDKNLELDDLIQIGNIGLIKAADKFNDSKNNKFSTYAYQYIDFYIKNSLTRNQLLQAPQKYKPKISVLNYNSTILTNKFGYEPSDEEIAENMNMKSEEFVKINKIRNDINYTSLDNIAPGTDTTNMNILPSNVCVENEAVIKTEVHQALKKLNTRQREYIILKFYKNYTAQQIADKYSASRQSVNQIIQRGLLKMKEYLN